MACQTSSLAASGQIGYIQEERRVDGLLLLKRMDRHFNTWEYDDEYS